MNGGQSVTRRVISCSQTFEIIYRWRENFTLQLTTKNTAGISTYEGRLQLQFSAEKTLLAPVVRTHTRQKWSDMFEDLSCTVRFYYNHKMAAKMADMQSMKQ